MKATDELDALFEQSFGAAKARIALTVAEGCS
jgi:hypothetical protein